MKIVINRCFGGFSLSPKAMKRLAKLQGRDCYFFKRDSFDGPYGKPVAMHRATGLFFDAFDIPNPDELLPNPSLKAWKGMSDKERIDSNKLYERHCIDQRPDDRSNPLLVQVVEELGDEANGDCAKLAVVEIPDGVEWEISEYDGVEHIAEKHRSWC